MPRRRSVLASAASTARASSTTTAAGRPSASASGWNCTGIAVLPVLAAALTVARRPDAAADLRTAEAA